MAKIDDNDIISEVGLEHFYRNVETQDFIKNNNLSMSKIKNVFQWLVYSSANPQALSLTLKSVVAFLVLFGVESTVAEDLSNGILQTIVSSGTMFSAVLMIFGALRKLWSLK